MSGIINSAGSKSGVIGNLLTLENTISDYEEGTFAVSVNCGSNSWTTNASHPLSYTKIGNMVYLRGGIIGSSHPSGQPTGTLSFDLPFACASLTGASDYCAGLCTAGVVNAMLTGSPMTLFVSGNATTAGVAEWSTTGNVGSHMADNMITNSQLYISLDYPTSA